MKITLIGFVVLILMSFTPSDEKGVLIHRLIVLPSSKLTIDGKTNVNTFQCGITRYSGRDTLVLEEGGRNKRPFFRKGFVGLEASSFDCGMKVMTSDFEHTIKAKAYPVVSIEFISFERVPKYAAEETFKGKLKISLGGVTKMFDMNCTIEAKEAGHIHLRGGRDFTFSDFNLEPPQKMMGMIKTKDELNVKFNLVLRLDSNR